MDEFLHGTGFRVLPEYRKLEEEASALTRQLSILSNENVIDRELVAELRSATANEQPPSDVDLVALYGEAGIVLPEASIRRFGEVRAFHNSVIQNRRLYLQGEIQAAEHRLTERQQTMEALDTRRSQIMDTLSSHGALDQYTKIQNEYSRQEATIVALRQQFEKAEQLERLSTEQEVERNQLFLRLQQDFREQREVLQQAILAFEEVSSSLYDEAGSGSLTISGTDNGPEFQITIQGQRSTGVGKMQIFCFDMMLMKMLIQRGLGSGFLIHDSHLFDGVDERQIANALEVGARYATEFGFQYIVTMNSDTLPEQVTMDFNPSDHVVSVRLTDATEDGGLFGFRFD